MSESVKSLPFECIDLLNVNEVEAAALSGQQSLDDIVTHFKTHWSHAEVIITLGKAGVMIFAQASRDLSNRFCYRFQLILMASELFIMYA